ncbi:hypothetical protein [Flavobacterium sp. CS20]|jgi:hypothetical protein|uniref:hypothetical protein n=1 Tax=Flavobacterium sp. CS20 TaxID=2775246 RepID=UPI001B3A775C|nr:hypothetical protein [Flavobacterium sp. CS20]QTY26327.1 hypothetical protein IGB25_10280 [Flavobacterium sp. CS20]
MINNSKPNLTNTIKLLIYKENTLLLKKLNLEDDNIFLEPLLFSYFNAKADNLSLEEILQGYFIEKESIKVENSYNKNDIAYIPEVGYFKKGQKTLYEPILKIGDFEILKEVHPLQEKYFVEFYKGHVVNDNPEHNSVWKAHHKELFQAIGIIKKYIPKYYEQLQFANKKIYLHDNPKIINFTSKETLGMLYFYVIGNNNIVYFIEELIHQGSHNYLHYILHDRKQYFKIDADHSIMRDLTKKQWDYRSVFSAFNGLFTVTQRVVYFDKLLDQNVFSGREKHELLGRLTDQFPRFRTGLQYLDLKTVYTDKGAKFYKDLDKKCAFILKKYRRLKDEFDLSNRDVDFRYDDFCTLNPYEEFLEKDKRGYYQF